MENKKFRLSPREKEALLYDKMPEHLRDSVIEEIEKHASRRLSLPEAKKDRNSIITHALGSTMNNFHMRFPEHPKASLIEMEVTEKTHGGLLFNLRKILGRQPIKVNPYAYLHEDIRKAAESLAINWKAWLVTYVAHNENYLSALFGKEHDPAKILSDTELERSYAGIWPLYVKMLSKVKSLDDLSS